MKTFIIRLYTNNSSNQVFTYNFLINENIINIKHKYCNILLVIVIPFWLMIHLFWLTIYFLLQQYVSDAESCLTNLVLILLFLLKFAIVILKQLATKLTL